MEAIDFCDLIEIGDGGRETAMYAEYLRVDYCGERQIGEDFYDTVPDVVISVFSEDLVIETVGSGKGSGFVVASEEDEGLRFEALEY